MESKRGLVRIRAAWGVVVVAAFAAASACGGRDDGCSKDSDCKGDRVCEHLRCAPPEDGHDGCASLQAEVDALKKVNAALEEEASARRHSDGLDDTDLRKTKLQLELCEALRKAEDSARPSSRPPPCNCSRSDPLCGC